MPYLYSEMLVARWTKRHIKFVIARYTDVGFYHYEYPLVYFTIFCFAYVGFTPKYGYNSCFINISKQVHVESNYRHCNLGNYKH